MKKLLALILLFASFCAFAAADLFVAPILIDPYMFSPTFTGGSISATTTGGAGLSVASAVSATTVPASGITGVTGIPQGGTNASSFTAPASGVNAIPYYDGARLVTDTVPGNLGYNAASGIMSVNSLAASGGYTQSGTSANTFTGNVSIGAASLGAPLGVYGAGGDGALFSVIHSGGTRAGITLYNDNNQSRNWAIVTNRYAYGDLAFDISNVQGGNPNLDSASSSKFYIDTSGNVSIGSTSPTGRLSVVGGITAVEALTATGNIVTGTKLLVSATAPTIASGFGTSPSISANGTASMQINVGTGGTASSGVIAMPTMSVAPICSLSNPLTGAGALTVVSAQTTNSITLTNYTIATDIALSWPASTVLSLLCHGL